MRLTPLRKYFFSTSLRKPSAVRYPPRTLENLSETVDGKLYPRKNGYLYFLRLKMDENYEPFQSFKNIVSKNDPSLEYVLSFDGASKGNPGRSSSGCAFFEKNSQKMIGKFGIFAGASKTNNEAEYLGLLNGLYLGLFSGISRVDIVGDSTLVIMQLLGRWRILTRHLFPLHYACRDLISQYRHTSLSTISRDKNTAAHSAADSVFTDWSMRVKMIEESIDEESRGNSGIGVGREGGDRVGEEKKVIEEVKKEIEEEKSEEVVETKKVKRTRKSKAESSEDIKEEDQVEKKERKPRKSKEEKTVELSEEEKVVNKVSKPRKSANSIPAEDTLIA